MKKNINILFHRDFKGFTGGHLKVWDYFQHIISSEDFTASIFFTAHSSWKNNPWQDMKSSCLGVWHPEDADVLFLAGIDWLALSEVWRRDPPAPVINLIQSVRHADKENPLYQFLKFPALRICVSQEVADAITNTGLVNGPVVVNANGIDHSLLPVPKEQQDKDISLLLVGNKNPELAKKLSDQLLNDGIKSCVLVNHLMRDDFLSVINRAKIAIFLPVENEGFYLPALEAMYLKTLVICPDCIGNRSFCVNNVTCFRPDYDFECIYQAVRRAINLSTDEQKIILENAYIYAKNSTLKKERKVFMNALSHFL